VKFSYLLNFFIYEIRSNRSYLLIEHINWINSFLLILYQDLFLGGFIIPQELFIKDLLAVLRFQRIFTIVLNIVRDLSWNAWGFFNKSQKIRPSSYRFFFLFSIYYLKSLVGIHFDTIRLMKKNVFVHFVSNFH
jgi:hypothetical protein